MYVAQKSCEWKKQKPPKCNILANKIKVHAVLAFSG